MYYDLIYTRCRHGIDILRSGQQILSDGFKVYTCSSQLYKENIVDLQFAMNSLQKKQSFNEPNFMDDAYLYAVPDMGLRFLNAFHPVPYDLSVTGDFAKRPGMYLNHAIIGEFEHFYPFETFHDKNVWTAQENNEAYYYENEPVDLGEREIKVSGSLFYSFDTIGAFVKDGRTDALKKAVAFLFEQFALPAEERKYLVIKDETAENIEKWVAAIELAFSPRIASSISFATRMDKFVTSNVYYVNDDGSFSQQQNPTGNHTRLRAMIVGVVSKDKINQVRVLNDSPYMVLDGENKKAEFDVSTSGEYFNILASFDEMHERFSREFLQSFDIRYPSSDLYDLAEAYVILCGSSFGSPGEYAKALSVLSKYKIYKTDIISEIYEKVNGRLDQFIKSSLEKSFPILNWVGEVSDIVGDSAVKTRLSEIIKNRAREVFFTEYKKGGFTDFWNEAKGGPFTKYIEELLKTESGADEYTEIIRSYDPSDAVFFLGIYCETCGNFFKKNNESAKLIVSYCIAAYEKKSRMSNSYQFILQALKKAVGSDSLNFLLDSVKTYEPEILDSVVNHVVKACENGKRSLNDIFLLCGALSECDMGDKGIALIQHHIEETEDVIELELFSEKVGSAGCFDEPAKIKIYELLDEEVKIGDQDSEILAASIQKNRPSRAVCTNSAHIVVLNSLLNMKKEDSVELCLKPYIKQKFPSVSSRAYVSRFTSALLKARTTKEDQFYVLELLSDAPETYMGQYMSSLVMAAESNIDKWDWTITYAYTSPDKRVKRNITGALKRAVISSGLKKKNLDALSKLLSDKSVRRYYEDIVDDVSDVIKEREGSLVSKLFGGFRK